MMDWLKDGDSYTLIGLEESQVGHALKILLWLGKKKRQQFYSNVNYIINAILNSWDIFSCKLLPPNS